MRLKEAIKLVGLNPIQHFFYSILLSLIQWHEWMTILATLQLDKNVNNIEVLTSIFIDLTDSSRKELTLSTPILPSAKGPCSWLAITSPTPHAQTPHVSVDIRKHRVQKSSNPMSALKTIMKSHRSTPWPYRTATGLTRRPKIGATEALGPEFLPRATWTNKVRQWSHTAG